LFALNELEFSPGTQKSIMRKQLVPKACRSAESHCGGKEKARQAKQTLALCFSKRIWWH